MKQRKFPITETNEQAERRFYGFHQIITKEPKNGANYSLKNKNT